MDLKDANVIAEKLLAFQSKKDIINLYKQLLVAVEDLKEDHLSMLFKLSEAFPNDLKTIQNLDYFDDEKANYIRKKILDYGNEAIRQFESNFKNYTVEFKKPNEKE